MPDSILIDASKQIIDVGIVGAVLVFAIFALVYVFRQWMNAAREVNAEKDKRIDDVRHYSAESAANRATIEANTTAIKTALEFVRRST
jgi:hypothetical protein